MLEHLYIVQIAANFLAIVLGPVTAVCITLWWQHRKDKKAAKLALFLTLMGERQALVISYQRAQALNTIDVVFAGCARSAPLAGEGDAWIELLTAMASELGYPIQQIQQTDLDKFYIPQGQAEDLEFQREASREWLRVLKNTNSLGVQRRHE